MVAHWDITVRSIIQGDSHDDVQSAALLATIPTQCTRSIEPKAKNAEWDNTTRREEVEW